MEYLSGWYLAKHPEESKKKKGKEKERKRNWL